MSRGPAEQPNRKPGRRGNDEVWMTSYLARGRAGAGVGSAALLGGAAVAEREALSRGGEREPCGALGGGRSRGEGAPGGGRSAHAGAPGQGRARPGVSQEQR